MQKIVIDLRPSKIFLIGQLLVLLACSGVICCLPFNLVIKLALSIGVLIYGFFIVYRYGLLLSPYAIRSIMHNGEQWLVRDGQNEVTAELVGDSTVTTLVSILRFAIPGEKFKRSCVVWKDSTTVELYRQLRVRVWWYPTSK